LEAVVEKDKGSSLRHELFLIFDVLILRFVQLDQLLGLFFVEACPRTFVGPKMSRSMIRGHEGIDTFEEGFYISNQMEGDMDSCVGKRE